MCVIFGTTVDNPAPLHTLAAAASREPAVAMTVALLRSNFSTTWYPILTRPPVTRPDATSEIAFTRASGVVQLGACRAQLIVKVMQTIES